ncbi:MAG: (2Fe-2S)-binding protein [Candidatus Omnitrophica bacterium]|nr:(2Fe-2S)-binding protein [Candidatus Omnitrophota bacterium]
MRQENMSLGKNNPIVCRCEEIRERDIIRVIKAGARDPDAVKRMLGAGMGLCQGKTCGSLIAKIIARETGRSLSELLPAKVRPPVRPIKIARLKKPN